MAEQAPDGPESLERLLSMLEAFYGKQRAIGPTDAFGMVIYRNCGYPPSEERCAAGYASLKRAIGLTPHQILEAPKGRLTEAMRPGGMMPAGRAERLQDIALSVTTEYGGNLGSILELPLVQARKALKRFPTIGDPTADKILLFTGTAALAALPSNCLHVLLRLGFGQERRSWAASYRLAQAAVSAQVPETLRARRRAYLLLKRHGEELCKLNQPRCLECPVSAHCRYYLEVARDPA